MSTDAIMLLIGIVVVGWVLSQISGYVGKKSREREERLGKKPALSEDEKMWSAGWMKCSASTGKGTFGFSFLCVWGMMESKGKNRFLPT